MLLDEVLQIMTVTSRRKSQVTADICKALFGDCFSDLSLKPGGQPT